MSVPLRILFEDGHLLVVSKPAGVVTQGNSLREPSLEGVVRRYLQPKRPDAVYLGTVHRLDRPVSGVILWAKTPKAARRVADQFARRDAKKEYWAVVQGHPEPERGIWSDWLCVEDTGLGRVQVCHPDAPRAKAARTRFLTEASLRDDRRLFLATTLARNRPDAPTTGPDLGRGVPIVGDQLYGSRVAFPDGIALHARSLTVRHPILDRPLSFESPLPDSWIELGFPAGSDPRG